jgi:hypothetical protein
MNRELLVLAVEPEGHGLPRIHRDKSRDPQRAVTFQCHPE